MKPPPKPTKTKAEQENAKRILQYKRDAREYANDLPIPDLIREIKTIGKREFKGTRFQQEALIFRFIALYTNSVKLVADLVKKSEELIAALEAEGVGNGKEAKAS